VHSSGKLTNETVDNASQERLWAWVLRSLTGISFDINVGRDVLEGCYKDNKQHWFNIVLRHILFLMPIISYPLCLKTLHIKKNCIFLVTALCSLPKINHRFEGICCVYGFIIVAINRNKVFYYYLFPLTRYMFSLKLDSKKIFTWRWPTWAETCSEWVEGDNKKTLLRLTAAIITDATPKK
jgi:hypothetical protein